jgi:short-subunit dehydrogenase
MRSTSPRTARPPRAVSVSEFAAHPLAVVTGASSGIGLELARQCAQHGFDLVAAAHRPLDAVAALATLGSRVLALEVDLSTAVGLRTFCDAIDGRPVDALLVNLGYRPGEAPPEQQLCDTRHPGGRGITGTAGLIHRIGRDMRRRGRGRILITGSTASAVRGRFQVIDTASKAFIDSFAVALRNELEDSGVTVTYLTPGIVDREFFEAAGLLDAGAPSGVDPATVAEVGFHAMMDGEGDVVAGLKDKLEVALAKLSRSRTLVT